MSHRFRKDVGEFITLAKRNGFRCEGMTGTGHWRLRHANGSTLIVPATPGGYRWRKNLESTMKKLTQGVPQP